MAMHLDEERQKRQQQIDRFVKAEAAFGLNETDVFPVALWRKMGEAGLLGLGIPTAYGWRLALNPGGRRGLCPRQPQHGHGPVVAHSSDRLPVCHPGILQCRADRSMAAKAGLRRNHPIARDFRARDGGASKISADIGPPRRRGLDPDR
jgi:hypothetical protein